MSVQNLVESWLFVVLFIQYMIDGSVQLMYSTRFSSSSATTRHCITTTLCHICAEWVHWDRNVCLCSQNTLFKNPVLVRWLGGGTPVRNNEFMYVASKSTLHSTLFICSRNLAVAHVLRRLSSVHFHPINLEPYTSGIHRCSLWALSPFCWLLCSRIGSLLLLLVWRLISSLNGSSLYANPVCMCLNPLNVYLPPCRSWH